MIQYSKRHLLLKTHIAIAVLLCAFQQARAAPDVMSCSADAMLVFDASGSMVHQSEGGKAKIDIARAAAHKIIPGLSRHRRLGLMTFGPGSSDACSNISLKVAPQSQSTGRILSEIDSLSTDGGTPLSSAVEAAANALDYANRPGVIVLMTDGDETCGRDPCEVARTLRANAPGLIVHVIGIDSSMSRNASCFAEVTNGQFIATTNLDQLVEALRETLACPLITSLPAPETNR